MPKHKSARHHWWPECVSKKWADQKGGVHRISPDGNVIRAKPSAFGVIGNAHLIKVDHRNNKPSPWDESFEKEFDRADNEFPQLVEWMESIPRPERATGGPLHSRFKARAAPQDQLEKLAECLVSLAVRSPLNRNAAASLAEHLRGPLPERERNALIGMNMRATHREVVLRLGSHAKFVLIYSPDREFIFGDGFFHNVRSPANSSIFSPKIIAPITPHLAAALTRPMSYMVEPKLVTFVATAEDALHFNHAVQVYSKNEIFFRSEQPELVDAFKRHEHLAYSHPDNPMDNFLRAIPGVPDRDRQFDDLMHRFGRAN